MRELEYKFYFMWHKDQFPSIDQLKAYIFLDQHEFFFKAKSAHLIHL